MPHRSDEPERPKKPTEQELLGGLPAADLTRYAVVSAALAVHRELGPGYRESVYQACLVYELRRRGMAVEEQVWLDVNYGNLRIERAGRADIIVDGILVVEIKAATENHPVFGAQVISYLKATDLPLGIVLNFGVARLIRDGYDKFLHPILWARTEDAPSALGRSARRFPRTDGREV